VRDADPSSLAGGVDSPAGSEDGGKKKRSMGGMMNKAKAAAQKAKDAAKDAAAASVGMTLEADGDGPGSPLPQ
jgi:hypothetical protein